MRADRVPDDVRVLLYERIESYEQLEILLLLHGDPSTWTMERISSRLSITQVLTEAALTSLEATRLVESSGSRPERHFRAAAGIPALDETIRRLASAYATQPIEIIKLMSAHAIERVRTAALRTFVDAFVLRKGNDKDKENG